MVVSNSFYFHPYLGKIPNLTDILQKDWNHQLVLKDILPSSWQPVKHDIRIWNSIGTRTVTFSKCLICSILGEKIKTHGYWTISTYSWLFFFQGAMNMLFLIGNRHKIKEDLGEFSPWRSSVSRWLLPRIEFHFNWEWKKTVPNGGKVWVKALENASNCWRRGFFETNETNWEAVGLEPRAGGDAGIGISCNHVLTYFLGSYCSCYWNSLYGSSFIL